MQEAGIDSFINFQAVNIDDDMGIKRQMTSGLSSKSNIV